MMHSMQTLRVRIKVKHARALDAMACEVNLVCNFVNDLSCTHTRRIGQFFSACVRRGRAALAAVITAL